MIEVAHPGPVGPVGDVLAQIKLKTSMPDIARRNLLNVQEQKETGSFVQDGLGSNYIFGGAPAIISKKIHSLSRKTKYGWTHQDLRAPDKRYEPTMSQSFSSFDNLQFKIYDAKRTGDMFLPIPGEYALPPGAVPRGGATPRITDLAAGDFTPGGFGGVFTDPKFGPSSDAPGRKTTPDVGVNVPTTNANFGPSSDAPYRKRMKANGK